MTLGNRSPQTDITVYGATGFVGRHVCKYLLEAAEAHGFALRLTLAGRNLSKLEERKTGLNIGNAVVDIFVADSSDLSSLLEMAERTRVVLACAGPFIKYGTNVVAACAETGADYIDITGEVTWAGRMRSQFGSAAKKSGARIISLCGFDSVPSDISIYAAVQALRESCGDDVKIKSGRTWHACMGALNGGTLHSALCFPVDLRHCIMSSDQPRKVPFLIDDPMVLTNPERNRHNPDHGEWKDRMAASEWWNQLPSVDSIVRGGVSIPFFMAPVNTKVVNASAVALNYGPAFTYGERFLPLGFRWTRRFGILSFLPALGFQLAISASFVVFKIPYFGQKLADWILPPGTGLPDPILEAGHAEVYAEVVTQQDIHGTVDRATTFIAFEGDPGNLVTAQCIGECALALVLNGQELPNRNADGFGTPAELLGNVLLKRLKESKVRKVHVTTTVLRKAPVKEKQIYM